MTNKEEGIPFNWEEAGPEWQSTPADIKVDLPTQQTDFKKLLSVCGRGAACACGVSGGFLASHFGCAVSPIIAATAGMSGTALPALSIMTSLGGTVLSVLTTTIGMGVWHRNWKKKHQEVTMIHDPEKLQRLQNSLELNKTLTLTGALTGMVLTVGFNLFADPDRQQQMQTAIDIYNLEVANGTIGDKSSYESLRDFLAACGLVEGEITAPIQSVDEGLNIMNNDARFEP
jgi:hypothetical protein